MFAAFLILIMMSVDEQKLHLHPHFHPHVIKHMAPNHHKGWIILVDNREGK